MPGALAQLLGGGGQPFGAFFAAQQGVDVARQIFKADDCETDRPK